MPINPLRRPGAFADVFDEKSGRRLAVRPGDAGHFQTQRRFFEKGERQIGQRDAAVRDHEGGGAGMRLRAFHHDRRRASLDRLFGELVAIKMRAAHRDVEAVLLHPARIVEDPVDLAIERPEDLPDRNGVCENFELHEVWTREARQLSDGH